MSDERDERMEQDPNPAQGDPASAHERSEESGSPYGQYTYRSPGGAVRRIASCGRPAGIWPRTGGICKPLRGVSLEV